MQLEILGVGGAGCRIADAIRAVEPATHSFIGDVFAFDTDATALAALTELEDSHRHRFGETVETGLDGDLQRGLEVGEECVDELSRQLDQGQPSAADAFLVCVGLGGATGGGTLPRLVANLQQLYDEPVYVLATLPADRELTADADVEVRIDEPAASASAPSSAQSSSASESEPEPKSETRSEPTHRPNAKANAGRTLEHLDGLANAVVCFDNERWLRTGESIADGRDRLNRAFATRVAALFAAGSDATDEVAETVIDASDVGRILGSETDVATLGYGSQAVETDDGSRFGLGLFSSEPDVDTTTAISAIETTVQKAVRGKLTLECERERADRAMLVVGGPPAWLNRQAIADGRRTLASATDSTTILGGDAPRPEGESVFAVVLLAGVEPVDRLEELRDAA